MSDSLTNELVRAAQSPEEAVAFIEAFARVNVRVIRSQLFAPVAQAIRAEEAINPNWDDPALLEETGVSAAGVDAAARSGTKYLHVDVAMEPLGREATNLFLGLTGLSDKLKKSLFPLLSSRRRDDRLKVAAEVRRLNHWLDWVREGGFDPSAFLTYQLGIKTHGQTQNLTGAIGATGAAIAFVDAIREIDPQAVVDHVGPIPPEGARSPEQIFEWRGGQRDPTLKALLLRNGKALVFASSKDANIFQSLGDRFASAKAAIDTYNSVRKDAAARRRTLHEFAVGEIKTATDRHNLHERMGLASRETQTELRTDRFLMMAVLNREIIEGGEQGRTMNNRDVRRFSHVFNLHHCWGWDGGRERHPEHWSYFVNSIREWCDL